MADELLILQEKPAAEYLIAGWRRQWSNGGRISSGLPRYLIEKLGAKKIGELAVFIQDCLDLLRRALHQSGVGRKLTARLLRSSRPSPRSQPSSLHWRSVSRAVTAWYT